MFSPSQAPAPAVRQRDVLVFLGEDTREHGYPPTLVEIADAVGVRPQLAHALLQRL